MIELMYVLCNRFTFFLSNRERKEPNLILSFESVVILVLSFLVHHSWDWNVCAASQVRVKLF